MNIKLSLAIILLCLGFFVKAQDQSLYKKENFISGNDTLPYRILLPLNYDASKKYPLIFFMHGAGERGNDNEAQLVHGAKLFLREDVRKNYPAIVVFPQCPQSSFWASVNFKMDSLGKSSFSFDANGEPSVGMKLANGLLHELMNEFKLQKKQIYVGGLSMGGMGTFEIVARNPGLFAAAMPICGGGDPSIAKKVKKTKWWVFHGAKDDVVPPANSQIMVAALKAAGANVKFSLYPDANHNSWDSAFAEPELLSWLFAQKK
jgi:predicted peptidase